MTLPALTRAATSVDRLFASPIAVTSRSTWSQASVASHGWTAAAARRTREEDQEPTRGAGEEGSRRLCQFGKRKDGRSGGARSTKEYQHTTHAKEKS